MEISPEIRHKFLHTCANKITIEKSLAIQILKEIWTKKDEDNDLEITENYLKSCIEAINNDITQFDQEIKYVTHDLTDEEYIVFTNIVDDSIFQSQKKWNEDDLRFFALLLREMITNSFHINPINALNLSSELTSKTFTKVYTEELISKWINLGYFIDYDSMIYFGPKIIAEYSSYLKRVYSDYLTDCFLCKKLTFWGNTCQNCNHEFHRNCLKKSLSKINKCPKCQKPWKT